MITEILALFAFPALSASRKIPTTQREIYRRNRERLALSLRDERLWPWSFSWDYDQPCGCAMGLAGEIGLLQPEDEFTEVAMARVLGMHPSDASDIFFYFNLYHGTPTPKNLANAIMRAPYVPD